MFKKNVTMVVLTVCALLAVSASLYAGKEKLKQETQKILTDEMEAQAMAKLKDIQIANQTGNNDQSVVLAGDTLFFTVRDFSMNTNIGRKIAVNADGSVHTIAQVQEDGGAYNMQYHFLDVNLGSFGALDVDAAQVNLRSGRVMNGPGGEAWISLHDNVDSESYLYKDAGVGFYSFTPTFIATGRFASADYKDGGTTWVTTNDADGNFEVDNFYYSTDGGANWPVGTIFELPKPDTATYQVVPGGVEIFPEFNPANPSELTVAATSEEFNNAVGDFGSLFIATTNDLSLTWAVDELYRKGELLSDLSYYLINNFSQVSTAYSSDGTLHLAFNGYGIQTDGSVGLYYIYTIGYWNSNMSSFHNEMQVLTGPEFVNPSVTSQVTGFYSGNEIGNAKPSVATSLADAPNPNVIAVTWSQPEIVNDTVLVSATGPGGVLPGVAIYATDIWCAVSGDNGNTWSAPFYVAGAPQKSDLFASLNENIIYDDASGSYFIDFVYMYDKVPGSFVFGQNEATPPAAWIYDRYDITAHIPVGAIDPGVSVASGFELSQNYPNPFNPSTTIAYNLKQAADVTLEVFNVTGQKVATLANGRKPAGQYEVNFDAADIASGIYFYTLNANGQSLTRKMVLMK